MKTVHHHKRASVNKHLTSSDSSDNEHTPRKQLCKSVNVRSSKRIKSRSRRHFHMPTRKDVFNNIPTETVTSRSVEKLRPCKLVNNFTRVTHRYNYDPVSSDDSELDDFIVDDLSYTTSDQSDEEDSHSKKKVSSPKTTSFKLKQRQHSSVLESDSDSDTEKATRFRNNSVIKDEDDEDEHHKDDSVENHLLQKDKLKRDSQMPSLDPTENQNSDPSSSGSEWKIQRSQKKQTRKASQHKKQVLLSDSESDSESEKGSGAKRRLISLEEDESSSGDVQRLYSSNEEDEKLPSERAQLMAARREARRRLFEQLRMKKRK